MNGRLAGAAHLVRLAAVFLGGVVVFLLLRAVLVPRDFGTLGHYRAGAIADVQAREPVYAGRAACADCHDDVVASRANSRHRVIGCETCHGPLGRHAADPEANVPKLPDASTLCVRCHAVGVARPARFPQVDPQEHSGGEACISCHQPHHPEVDS